MLEQLTNTDGRQVLRHTVTFTDGSTWYVDDASPVEPEGGAIHTLAFKRPDGYGAVVVLRNVKLIESQIVTLRPPREKKKDAAKEANHV